MLDAPADLVLVGRIADAWGLRGGVKIIPYSNDAEALLGVRQWWIGAGQERAVYDVDSAKSHGTSIAAFLTGITDRDAAERMKGSDVSISRNLFPQLADEQYYWVDLIGLEVLNDEGESFGHVKGLLDNGAHQILEVDSGLAGLPLTLIPFVSAHVKAVDLRTGKIEVDWQRDY